MLGYIPRPAHTLEIKPYPNSEHDIHWPPSRTTATSTQARTTRLKTKVSFTYPLSMALKVSCSLLAPSHWTGCDHVTSPGHSAMKGNLLSSTLTAPSSTYDKAQSLLFFLSSSSSGPVILFQSLPSQQHYLPGPAPPLPSKRQEPTGNHLSSHLLNLSSWINFSN